MTRGRRGAALLAGVLLLGATACSGDDDAEAEADADETAGRQDSDESAAELSAELADVVQSSTAEPYRFDLVVALGAAPEDGTRPDEEPLVTGSSDGERLQIRFEGNSPIADLLFTFGGSAMPWLPADADVDRSVDLVLDGEAAYVHSPLFSVLGQSTATGETAPPPGVVDLAAQIGDGWGRIDRAQLDGVLPAPLRDWTPTEGFDAAMVGDFLDGLGDLRRLDDSDIDGQEMSGYGVDASLDESLGFVGIDPSSLPLIGGFVGGRVGAVEFPVEMWVDGDERFRRLHVPFDGSALAEEDEATPDLLASLSLDVTLDVFDYGNESIAVETPAQTVDVTGDFVSALLGLVIGAQ